MLVLTRGVVNVESKQTSGRTRDRRRARTVPATGSGPVSEVESDSLALRVVTRTDAFVTAPDGSE